MTICYRIILSMIVSSQNLFNHYFISYFIFIDLLFYNYLYKHNCISLQEKQNGHFKVKIFPNCPSDSHNNVHNPIDIFLLIALNIFFTVWQNYRKYDMQRIFIINEIEYLFICLLTIRSSFVNFLSFWILIKVLCHSCCKYLCQFSWNFLFSV